MINALGFFGLIALVCVCCIAVLAATLLRPKSVLAEEKSSRKANIAAAKERLAQLDEQIGAGLIGGETEAEYRKEIEIQLLKDADQTQAAELPQRSEWRMLAACIVVIAVGAPLLYAYFGAPNHILPKQMRLAALDQPLEDGSGLAENNPEELARQAAALMEQKDYAGASKIYAKLRTILGNNSQLLAGNLNASILAGEEITELLEVALSAHPENPYFLWVAGLESKKQGDVVAARDYWQRAHDLLPEGTQEQSRLKDALDRLRREADDAGQSPSAVQVELSLDPAMAEQADPATALYIFARAEDGPPMPLAVRRLTVADLPLTLTLDDDDAMMPDLRMSLFDSYKIIARISKSGDTKAAPGDLFGETDADPGDTVILRIDSRVL